MKKQISRLSPHQNGKVFGILIAVVSLIFVVPMAALSSFVMPPVDPHGKPVPFPTFLLVLFPVFYFIFGYISAAIGCAIYNFFFKYIGGFEFELLDKSETVD